MGARLETRILGTAKGDGKFLKAGDLTDVAASTETTQGGEEHHLGMGELSKLGV